MIGGVEDEVLAQKAVEYALSHSEKEDWVPTAVEYYNKEVRNANLKLKRVNLTTFRNWLKTYLKKESEAKSTQEISSGNSKKKRKRVKELPQLFIDEEEKIYAMLATRGTGNNVKKKIFFDDFSRDLYNGILRKVTGIGKKWSKDDRLEVKGRLLAANNYAKVKALAIKATERDVQKV